jgi:F0F1-type ATP synthase assembly protein I
MWINMGEFLSEKEPKDPWWRLPLLFFFQLSSWIVAPVILALVLGWWLEKYHHFDSWIYLVTVGIAFIVSIVGMVKEGSRAIKTMDNIGREKTGGKNQKDPIDNKEEKLK